MTTAMKPQPAVDRPVQPVPSGDVREMHADAGSGGRWWLAVAVASVIGIPCGWVLSYAALLPFFIGVFFFAVFGLIIGAVAYRFAAPGRPYAKTLIVVGTTVIILVTFAASLWKEGRDFPSDVATRALKNTRSIGILTPAEFRHNVEGDVRRFLAAEYWPGGTIGYLRWTLTSGRISKKAFDWMERDIVFPQARYLFAVRVALSLGLLAFGVASQTLTLRQSVQTGGLRPR